MLEKNAGKNIFQKRSLLRTLIVLSLGFATLFAYHPASAEGTIEDVVVAQEKLATASGLVSDARKTLEESEAKIDAASVEVRETMSAELEANRKAVLAQQVLSLVARETYRHGGSSKDLSLLVGLATDGPEGLRSYTSREQLLSQIGFSSTGEAQLALSEAEIATENSDIALEAYQTAVEEKDEAHTLFADAKEDLALAQAEYQRQRAAYDLSQTLLLQTPEATLDGGTCSVPSQSEVAPNDNAKYLWGVLISRGFTEQAAAGVLGNLQQESGIDPTVVQSNGVGHGIAQWSQGGRWDTGEASLISFAEGKNLDPMSMEAQTGFLLYEMENGWGGFDLNYYKTMTNVVEATTYFHDVFEKSADSEEFVQIVRGGYAEEWLNTLSGTVPLQPGTPSCATVPSTGSSSSPNQSSTPKTDAPVPPPVG